MAAFICLLCNNSIAPGQRVFLKTHEDPLVSINEVLCCSGRNKEQVDEFLKNRTVCKTGCIATLKRLGKINKEITELKSQIEESIGKSFEKHYNGPNTSTSTCCPTTMIDVNEVTPVSRERGRTRLTLDTPTRRAVHQPVASSSSSPVDFFVKRKVGQLPKVKPITRSLKSLGRSVGRRNRVSIVHLVMKDKLMKKKVIMKVCAIVKKEMRETCTDKKDSIFKDKRVSTLEQFSWQNIAQDLRRTAPVLSSILDECNKIKSTDNNLKKDIRMCVAAGVLLKGYSERACLIQRIVSLLLYASHSPKQLYDRLLRAGVCVSHKSTIRLADRMGLNYDVDVNDWAKHLTETLFKDDSNETNEDILINDEELLAIIGDEDTNSASLENVSSTTNDYNQGQTMSQPTEQDFLNESSSDSCTVSDVTPPVFSHVSMTTCSSQQSSNPQPSETESDDLATGTTVIPSFKLHTYKLVGDNIDKSIKPRHESSNIHTDTIHYFHSFAVQDRCDMSSFSDDACLCDTNNVNVSVLMPNEEENISIRKNATVIISRILQKHFQFFNDNVGPVTRHISHVHSKEMSQKSNVVPLGVLTKNENKHEDMKSIMVHLQQYVPFKSECSVVSDPETNEEYEVFVDRFHNVLFGGDQLTVERATGSKFHCSNEWRGLDRLEGLCPVIEDWHAKVCLLKAIWRLLYKTSSGSDSATLYYLRNLVQRRAVTVEIKSDPTACEEFFLLVVEAHVISLAMQEFQIESANGTPAHEVFSKDNFLNKEPSQRMKIFMEAISKVLDQYMFSFILDNEPKEKPKEKPKKRKGTKTNGMEDKVDHVKEYARELLSLGLLYMEFTDAIREGDGLRILDCWKCMLLIFKVTDKRKYAIQAATLLIQYEFTFTERMKNQLLWNRTVNVHGRPGRNIPCDLFMEHLNRELKESMHHLSSNVNEKSIIRIGKCLGKLIKFKNNYDKHTGVVSPIGYHTSRSQLKDLQTLIEELNKTNVFTEVQGRKHRQFPNFKGNTVLYNVDKKELTSWLQKQLVKLTGQ